MKANLIWLASYPKSGNTWFRTFLTAILNPEQAEIDINNMEQMTIASSREMLENFIDIESSELTQDEIDLLRPDEYRALSEELEEKQYFKIHDAFTRNAAGEWIFPPELTWKVIYLVRNPLDVAVSYANHNTSSLEKAIEYLCDSSHCLASNIKSGNNQIRQKLLTWQEHVKSWLESPNKVCVLRYEDMKQIPLETFRRAVDFLELKKTDDEILAALDKCRIEKLQQQEKENSFKEKPWKCDSFFRKGIVGDWREHFSPGQAERLIGCNYETMLELGYVDANRNPVF
ncbi:MAG: sulfotransferase domain-containing protein [Victivallales bacterium]|nr:sulfotransferase domain-containing protein [Victivallales bacterium]